MSKILSLAAREIADSRGRPTIDVEIKTERASGSVSVPSGASVGTHEAKVVEPATAVVQINTEINAALVGKDFDQKSIDDFLIQLDGPLDKSRLGGNALLGISLAFARAAAAEQGVELYKYFWNLSGVSDFKMPQPMFNVLNGGKHAQNSIDIQECMLMPQFGSIKQRVQEAYNIVDKLRAFLQEKNYETSLGDEGGFAPALTSSSEALDLLVASIDSAEYTGNIKLAIDVAASSISAFDKEKMSAWYSSIIKKYPLVSIEDPFMEDDWERFATLRAQAGEVLVVGDDLTVTNTGRIALAAQKNAINAVIIKPNQVGTVSETILAAAEAKKYGFKIIASHRSGETLDTWIADIAVGLGCEYIKAGAPTRPERVAKYNRLIEIEKTL